MIATAWNIILFFASRRHVNPQSKLSFTNVQATKFVVQFVKLKAVLAASWNIVPLLWASRRLILNLFFSLSPHNRIRSYETVRQSFHSDVCHCLKYFSLNQDASRHLIPKHKNKKVFVFSMYNREFLKSDRVIKLSIATFAAASNVIFGSEWYKKFSESSVARKIGADECTSERVDSTEKKTSRSSLQWSLCALLTRVVITQGIIDAGRRLFIVESITFWRSSNHVCIVGFVAYLRHVDAASTRPVGFSIARSLGESEGNNTLLWHSWKSPPYIQRFSFQYCFSAPPSVSRLIYRFSTSRS